jgi:DNA processing protein
LEEIIKTLEKESKNYPRQLRKIKSPPEILYLRGEFPFGAKVFFSIVGTRRCSNYGKEIAFSFAKELAERGVVIVSGMARGIDTQAHKGALEAGGATIAVLGTGVDEKSIYPKENLLLSRKIISNGGCLISEYPPGTPGRKENFPKRNRLISGLSEGVLVVEAKIKSGALITARFAKSQGKTVFAVPGPVHSLNSRGAHHLIKQGAKLAETVEDILKFIKIPKAKKQEALKGKTLEEELVMKALKEGAANIEEIIKKTKLAPREVAATLGAMELENKVKNLGGNTYMLNF